MRASLSDLQDLEAALLDGVEAGVRRAAETIAFAAKADHPYTDRTTTLTNSIEAVEPTRAGSEVRGAVVAEAPYASYLEARAEYAFLAPVAAREEARIEHDMDAAVAERLPR